MVLESQPAVSTTVCSSDHNEYLCILLTVGDSTLKKRVQVPTQCLYQLKIQDV